MVLVGIAIGARDLVFAKQMQGVAEITSKTPTRESWRDTDSWTH